MLNKHNSICPCCNATSGEAITDEYRIVSSSFTSLTKRRTTFRQNPFYCSECGHIYNVNQPSKKGLAEYYNDQVDHIAEDFDLSKRVDLISSFKTSSNLSMLDYGGNSKRNFHLTLEDMSWSVQIADINHDKIFVKFDLLTAYFVFEHLVDLDDTMNLFNKIINNDGIIIIEVPDTNIYKTDYSGLICEHQQHFQISSLTKLFSRFGFSLIFHSEEKCSRTFGFVAVFKKNIIPIVNHIPIVNNNVKNYYQIARKKQIAEKDFPNLFFKKNLSVNKKGVVFWGVNANLENIIDNFKINLEYKFAIDINPDKHACLDKSFIFFEPEEFFKTILEFLSHKKINVKDLMFVITATEHYKVIQKELDKVTNEYFLYDPISKYVG